MSFTTVRGRYHGRGSVNWFDAGGVDEVRRHSRFIGVEWQLEPATSDATTACTGTITVGDISLY
jgi:hypothetical protein